MRARREILHPTTSRAGFSLIELLGVLMVLGMIASLVMVNWARLLPGTKLHSAVHNLGAAIQGARSDSIARNGEFRLYYDIEQASWWVLSPYGVNGTTVRSEEERVAIKRSFFPDNISIQRVTAGGTEFTEGTVYITFDPLGRTVDHTVTLVNTTYGDSMTIEVLPLTGLVRFHDGDFLRPLLEEGDF